MKTYLTDLVSACQTAFNTPINWYSVIVVEQLTLIYSCQTAVIKVCAGITTNCGLTMQAVADKIVRSDLSTTTFANTQKYPPKGRVSRNPTVSIPFTKPFIVAQRPATSADFADFSKNALIKEVNPAKVKLKVDRVSRAEGNDVRIEVRSVDLDKLRLLKTLTNAGLDVKDDSKCNLRLYVFGVPKEMRSVKILSIKTWVVSTTL